MEEIIKLQQSGGILSISEDVSSMLKNLFSGCRVNFLLGAGFSADILKPLNNYEILFEALSQCKYTTDEDRNCATILSAFLYWSFFQKCIAPVTTISPGATSFKPYLDFEHNLYTIFSERGNPALDRQFNIFTTNYDPLIEVIFDHSNCICNDGFEGRITPFFSTDNYSKTYYRHAVFSNRKAEMPSVNLVKIHGSLTWKKGATDGTIEYQDYTSAIQGFETLYTTLFDVSILAHIESTLTAFTVSDAENQVLSIIKSGIFDGLKKDVGNYNDFILNYKTYFLIINPTKEKFSSTLQNKNYYELLRIFSNELEKENSLLVSNGFSFRDEHILDLVKRSMVNPSLKILIFCFKESEIDSFKLRLGNPKNDNISYICIDGDSLDLKYFNQILSVVHI